MLFLNNIINAVINHSQQAAELKESKGKKVTIAAYKGIFVAILYLVGFGFFFFQLDKICLVCQIELHQNEKWK